MHKPSGVPSARWLLPVGILTLLAGIAVSVAMVGGGVDFPVLYVMGRGLLRGENVYLPEQTAAFPLEFNVAPSGMYYPPATGFAVWPIALLPVELAKWIFAILTIVTVVSGVRALVRLAYPSAQPGRWMIVAGLVLMTAAMRWGLMLLQVAPFMFGLLCWFVALLHTDKRRSAVALATLAMTLKMTLSLPFLGLLALRRRWSSLAIVGILWAILDVVGFWRMGPGSFAAYQRSIATLGEIGNIDSPDLWRALALPRLDWVPLIYSLTASLTFARATALALSGASGLWLLWQMRRLRPEELTTTAPFLGALVCLGSLAVYHHQYDAVLFLAPALVGVLTFEGYRPGHLLIAPMLAMILVLPIGRAQSVMQNMLGLTGVGLLKLSFPIAVTLALAGCLLLISQPASQSRDDLRV